MLFKNGYSKSATLIHAVFFKCYFESAISTGAVLSGHQINDTVVEKLL